jgi:6-methylsalicylate decarboxylase
VVRHGGDAVPPSGPALASAFGSHRLLYGSDYCWTPADGVTAQIAAIDAARQPDGTTWRALASANAKRLFPQLASDS